MLVCDTNNYLEPLEQNVLKFLRQHALEMESIDRNDIADAMGVSYPTIMRVLSKLSSTGFVDGKRLSISKENKKVFWGISFGTSHIKICLIDFPYTLLDTVCYESYFERLGISVIEAEDEPEHIQGKYVCYKTPLTYDEFVEKLNSILDCILCFVNSTNNYITSGVGIAFSGAVDKQNGILKKAISIKYLEDVSLLQIISPKTQKKFDEKGIALVFDHNAKAAAVAEKEALYYREDMNEHYRGSSRKKNQGRNMLCFYLGTGIGAGLILDNRLYTGTLNYAGEVSHFPLFLALGNENDPLAERFAELTGKTNLPFCSCGNINCFERYVKTLDEFIKECNANESSDNSHKISEAYQLLGALIGYVITALVNTLNIDTVVCTGRLTKYYNHIEPFILTQTAKNGVSYTRNCCKVIDSRHGKLAPSVGVAIEACYAHLRDRLDWNIVPKV